MASGEGLSARLERDGWLMERDCRLSWRGMGG